MTKLLVPLTALSEDQRAQPQSWFAIVCPALEESNIQAKVDRIHTSPCSTVQFWMCNVSAKRISASPSDELICKPKNGDIQNSHYTQSR